MKGVSPGVGSDVNLVGLAVKPAPVPDTLQYVQPHAIRHIFPPLSHSTVKESEDYLPLENGSMERAGHKIFITFR